MHPASSTSVSSLAPELFYWYFNLTLPSTFPRRFMLCLIVWAQIMPQSWLLQRDLSKPPWRVKKYAVRHRRGKNPYLDQLLLNLCPASMSLVRSDEIWKSSEQNRAVKPQEVPHLFSLDWLGRFRRFLISRLAFAQLVAGWSYSSLWWQKCKLQCYLARLV